MRPEGPDLPPPHPEPASQAGPDPEELADRAFWSAQYGREITKAELEEIKTNLLGLARLLIADEIEQSKKRTGPRA